MRIRQSRLNPAQNLNTIFRAVTPSLKPDGSRTGVGVHITMQGREAIRFGYGGP
jgi:hypothetical protein